ncbi:hypothetical protein CJ483_22860 [Bacillus sp. PK3_68]|nr:hypothetical protein CJ483_22860 [Bacillus sp. PK3_68]
MQLFINSMTLFNTSRPHSKSTVQSIEQKNPIYQYRIFNQTLLKTINLFYKTTALFLDAIFV